MNCGEAIVSKLKEGIGLLDSTFKKDGVLNNDNFYNKYLLDSEHCSVEVEDYEIHILVIDALIDACRQDILDIVVEDNSNIEGIKNVLNRTLANVERQLCDDYKFEVTENIKDTLKLIYEVGKKKDTSQDKQELIDIYDTLVSSCNALEISNEEGILLNYNLGLVSSFLVVIIEDEYVADVDFEVCEIYCEYLLNKMK